MSYKTFQDWYHEAEIKHLLLIEHKGNLISPPFATELCKDYSTMWHSKRYRLKLSLPEATSKTNACCLIDNEEIWFVPYGIYDDLNIIVCLMHGEAHYHKLPFKGKGQYYSIASNGQSAFSFPLGYEGTNYGIYIKDQQVSTHELPHQGKKLHMGTVYCNGRYWSMPRGDTEYNMLLSFDGKKYDSYELTEIDNTINRKYTDIVVKDNTLYSLPYGETAGINDVIEFDTDTNTISYHKLDVPDFAKKYNVAVMLDDVIIGLPYGDQNTKDSNWGVVFNTVDKSSKAFDIGISHGGKYRYRCGIAHNNNAFFFPSGTPSCPILKIDKEGNIISSQYYNNILLGRPILYENNLVVIGYEIDTKNHYVLTIDSENLSILDKSKMTNIGNDEDDYLSLVKRENL